MDSVTLYCLLLAGLGISLVYWAKRRSFVRENNFGVEQFPSYGRKVLSRLTDGFLQATGYGCVAAAMIILLIEYAWEWVLLGCILYVAFKLDDEWYGRTRAR